MKKVTATLATEILMPVPRKARNVVSHNMKTGIITIFLTVFYLAPVMSQDSTYNSLVTRLFFGVNIVEASSSLVDSLQNVQALHHNDIVHRQSNLNTTIQMGVDEQAWSSAHIFTFTNSPFPGFKIKSGQIEVTIGEAAKIKKLLNLNWQVNFDTKKDADLFFEYLKKISRPLSTINKLDFDKEVGRTAEYSIRKTGQKGIKDISFILDKDAQANNYQISFFLFNDLDDD